MRKSLQDQGAKSGTVSCVFLNREAESERGGDRKIDRLQDRWRYRRKRIGKKERIGERKKDVEVRQSFVVVLLIFFQTHLV